MKTSELVLNFLKEQGLMPTRFDDNYIAFKYQMRNFLYRVIDEDPNFVQFIMPGIFEVTDDNRDCALLAANDTCKRVKVVKALVYENEVVLFAECFIGSTPVLEDVVPCLLDALLAGQQLYYEELNR